MKMFVSEIDEVPSEPFGLGLSEYGAVLSDMDDIWSSLDRRPDKFELLELPLGEFALDDSVLEDFLDWSLDTLESNKIVHHDCMWAGTCSDKYHPGNGPVGVACGSSMPPSPPPTAPVQPTLPGRSLLLSAARAPPRSPRAPKKVMATPERAQPSPKRPDTPQSLDEDEPPQFKHTIDLAACAPRPTYHPARTPARVTVEDYEFDDEDRPEAEEEDSDEGTYVEYSHPAYNVRDSRTYRENTIASDHSYTLCKSSKQTRLESLGIQTPSDSEEEEIDVESLGEKLAPGTRGPVVMPTNPSAMDRHQLQRTVASAMGARSPQPARPARPACSSRPRKRPRDRSPPAQSSRYRKRKKIAADPRRSPAERRSFSSPNSDSEADNIEKRSLHNDMERQRRIGLKNLFDELKREVPSIREKERAPKVVVLREAAALCTKLQREEREREQLRARQSRLLARVRHLRLDLAARRPNA